MASRHEDEIIISTPQLNNSLEFKKYDGISLSLPDDTRGGFIEKNWPQKYWNVRMPDGTIDFAQGATYAEAQESAHASRARIIEGLAWDIEVKTQDEISKVRTAIGEAGLSGTFGSPEVYNPQAAAIRASKPITVGGANTEFFVRLTSADQLRVIGELLTSNTPQIEGQQQFIF